MKKVFVLDTNVLLDDPSALFSFKKNDVILPYKVIEELDKHKTSYGETGMNARDCARKISDIFKKKKTGSLKNGIQMPKLGKLQIVSVNDFSKHEIEISSPDDHILAVTVGIKKEWENYSPTLVTNDILLSLKARSFGIDVENYDGMVEITSLEELYAGYKVINVSDSIVGKYWEEIQSGEKYFSMPLSRLTKEKVVPNDFLLLNGKSDCTKQKPYQLLRVVDNNELLFVKEKKMDKIKPMNVEQAMAIDLLTDTNVDLVTLTGISGTGKTLLSIAVGLDLVLNKKKYKNIIILRPMHAVGKDIGYLPGPQPLDTKILTPNGWTTMGKLKIGDEVISRNGKPSKILKIFPKGKKPVYKLTTNNGQTAECCENHLWLTKNHEEKKRGKVGSVKTTKQILETLKVEKNGKIKLNHYLPRNNKVEFNKKDLPLSPYVLGVLIGDGSISNSINITSQDKDAVEIIDRVNSELKQLGCVARKIKGTIQYNISSNVANNKPARPVMLTNINTNEIKIWEKIGEASKELGIKSSTIYSRCMSKNCFDDNRYEFLSCTNRWSNPVKNICHELNLLNCNSTTKFIPFNYLYQSSIEDRISLLQGLMDTDGTIKKNGESNYTTSSSRLADDIIELVKSLGGNAVKRTRNKVGKQCMVNNRIIETKNISYDISIFLPEDINPFFLSRKAKRHKCSYIYDDKIKKIEQVSEKEVQCILIDDPEHLYITNDYIVTHNTKEEKLEPWTAPIKDNIRFCMSNDNGKKSRKSEENLQYLTDRGFIEIEAMTYARGRSLNEAFIIVDESQNINIHELKTILTRVGQKTKIVLTGDIEQTDRNDIDSISNGLSVAVEKFKNYNLAGHVTMKDGVRSKLSELAAKIL